MPNDSLHGYQVYNSLEGIFLPYWDLDRAGLSSEHIDHLTLYLVKVCARAVHLINVCDAWHLILISLTPYSLTLRLYTAHGTKSSHSTIEDTERALYLDSKVNVSRGVDQVDLILLVIVGPEGRSRSRGDRDTTLLLLLHPVHRSGTIMYLSDLVC